MSKRIGEVRSLGSLALMVLSEKYGISLEIGSLVDVESVQIKFIDDGLAPVFEGTKNLECFLEEFLSAYKSGIKVGNQRPVFFSGEDVAYLAGKIRGNQRAFDQLPRWIDGHRDYEDDRNKGFVYVSLRNLLGESDVREGFLF